MPMKNKCLSLIVAGVFFISSLAIAQIEEKRDGGLSTHFIPVTHQIGGHDGKIVETENYVLVHKLSPGFTDLLNCVIGICFGCFLYVEPTVVTEPKMAVGLVAVSLAISRLVALEDWELRSFEPHFSRKLKHILLGNRVTYTTRDGFVYSPAWPVRATFYTPYGGATQLKSVRIAFEDGEEEATLDQITIDRRAWFSGTWLGRRTR